MQNTVTTDGPTMLSLEHCKWQKNLNQLSAPWNISFPREIFVYNPKTSKYKTYFHLHDNDPRFDQDLIS